MLITGISYLSYFGLSTNKFNSRIENKIKESYPNINVELQNVKILLDILKIKSFLIKNPLPCPLPVGFNFHGDCQSGLC